MDRPQDQIAQMIPKYDSFLQKYIQEQDKNMQRMKGKNEPEDKEEGDDEQIFDDELEQETDNELETTKGIDEVDFDEVDFDEIEEWENLL